MLKKVNINSDYIIPILCIYSQNNKCIYEQVIHMKWRDIYIKHQAVKKFFHTVYTIIKLGICFWINNFTIIVCDNIRSDTEFNKILGCCIA